MIMKSESIEKRMIDKSSKLNIPTKLLEINIFTVKPIIIIILAYRGKSLSELFDLWVIPTDQSNRARILNV